MRSPDLARAADWVRRHGRPLDVARLDAHLFGGPAGAVADAIAAYQNPDGGLHGLEPDLRTTASSAIATSLGLTLLREVGHRGPVADRAVAWLVAHHEPGGWRTVGPEVDDAPHAPWWDLDPATGRTQAGSAVNPTAEIVGHLLDAGHPLGARLLPDLVAVAARGIDEVHDYACFLRLRGALAGEDRAIVDAALRDAAARLVERDPAAWAGYAIRPLALAPLADGPAVDLLRDDLARDLDHVAGEQGDDGAWHPPWTWFDGRHPEVWAVAEREWTGHLTVEKLRSFRSHGRI